MKNRILKFLSMMAMLLVCTGAMATNWTNYPSVAAPNLTDTFLIGTTTTNEQFSAANLLNWIATNQFPNITNSLSVANLSSGALPVGVTVGFSQITGVVTTYSTNLLENANGNWFLGSTVGNSSASGTGNLGAGDSALASLANGSANVIYGQNAGNHLTSAWVNVANGVGALFTDSSGWGNVADGYNALTLATGQYNIGVGYNGGSAITTGSSNIMIGNIGLSTDTSVIRIGSSQSATYLVGKVYASTGNFSSLSVSNAPSLPNDAVNYSTYSAGITSAGGTALIEAEAVDSTNNISITGVVSGSGSNSISTTFSSTGNAAIVTQASAFVATNYPTLNVPTWNTSSGLNLLVLDANVPESILTTTDNVTVAYSTNGVAGKVIYSNIQFKGGATNRTLFLSFYPSGIPSITNGIVGISTNVTLLANRNTILTVKFLGDTANLDNISNTLCSIIQ